MNGLQAYPWRETGLEEILYKIIKDPRYIEGLAYGKPRRGHEEGTIAAHILEIEKTLYKLFWADIISDDEFFKLKLLVHVHDTFKKWATSNAPIDDYNSHASLAAKFLSEFTDDKDLIAMVQWHDENFAIWKKYKKTGEIDVERISRRVLTINDIDLFLIFTIIDGYTKSKMALAGEERPEKLRWFIEQVNRWKSTPRAFMALELLGL